MKINECMTLDAFLCAPDDTIQQAAELMSKADVGFLPVGENDRLIGMITDRDIAIRAVARDRPPSTLVRAVMTPEVLYCYADEEADEVARKFSDQQVRRLPVLNRQKRLVGIVSLCDLARPEAGIGLLSVAALRNVSRAGGLHSQH